VGNGNTDVGNKIPTRKPGQPSVESLIGRGGFLELRIDGLGSLKADQTKVCGAMSQQHGDSGRGNESVPQKFVQLVGCRDPNARTEPWVRPRAAPLKR
jgi:hypothetical protein